MLESLSERLQGIFSGLRGKGRLSEDGINDALLVDNTGRWRDVPGLEQHLNRPGISRVLLTAPGKGDMKNIVFGVNDNVITDEDLARADAAIIAADVKIKQGERFEPIPTLSCKTNEVMTLETALSVVDEVLEAIG